MEFIEQPGAVDLQTILEEEQSAPPIIAPTTSTLYERRENPAAEINTRIERLVDHVLTIEETRRNRQIPRSVIRDRILKAMLLGTITMNVSHTNHVTGTSFHMRPLSAEERVFGRFMSEEIVPTDAREVALI